MEKVKIMLLHIETLFLRASEWLSDDEAFDAEWMDAKRWRESR